MLSHVNRMRKALGGKIVKVVSIIGHNSCLNKGDEALLKSTICLVENFYKREKGEKVKFIVFSPDPVVDKAELINYLERGSKVFFRKRLVPRFSRNLWGTFKILFRIFYLIIIGFLVKTSLLRRRDEHDEARRSKIIDGLLDIKDSDIVIVRGGDMIADIYGVPALLGLLLEIYLSLMVNKNKTIVLIGHTIGPFKYKISRFITKKILSKVSSILVRDRKSLAICQELGLNVDIIPDVAFALLPYEDNISELEDFNDTSRKKVGIVPSKLIAKYGKLFGNNLAEKLANYKELIKEIAIHFLERNFDVWIIPHVFGPRDENKDHLLAQEIYEELKKWYGDRIHLTGKVEVEVIKKIIGTLDLLITSRMHPGIHALSMGVPVIALQYSFKMREVYSLSNGTWEVVDIREITPRKTYEQVVEIAHRVLNNTEVIKKLDLGLCKEVDKHVSIALSKLIKG